MSVQEILILKFGGSVLENDVMIRKASRMVKDAIDGGYRIVVVVSALKGMTDHLLTLSKKLNPEISPKLMDEILSMGEKTSARIFAGALLAEGLSAVVIDTDSDSWPIITNDLHGDASPIESQTKESVERGLKTTLGQGEIPVVCGFIGKSTSGSVTTMGRGGSDTTAVVLGSYLDATEVILVKDVSSVLSSDPSKVDGTIAIEELDSEEAFALASGGAKFLHSKSLRYKRSDMRIRVSSLENNPFSGTVIDGGAPDLEILIMSENISKITLIGSRMTDTEILTRVVQRVKEKKGRVISMSLDPKTATFYVEGDGNMADAIHSSVVGGKMAKAISSFENLTMLNIGGRAMETIPGMIQRVAQPLAHAGINIYGMTTIGSSIRLFTSKEDSQKALDMLRDALAMFISES
jgi:aspartate kinase